MVYLMYYIDKIQAQGRRQRKIGVPKKFWREFPLNSWVKVEVLDQEDVFFVDIVQAQGKVQRRIPVPQKFWDMFEVGGIVKITLMRMGR